LHPEKSKQFLKSRTDIDRSKLTVRHNIRARSLKGIIAEFAKNESFRLVKRKDSVRLYHTVLSLSNKDRALVDEKVLNDLAKKYVALRGLNNLYVGACHFDKDHAHIHIVHSGTSLDGRSSRVTKQQFHSIKLNLERYQLEQYPFLTHSLVDHGKKRRLAKEDIIKSVQANRQTKKEGLLASLERLAGTATSKEQFIEQLQQLGHEVYFRNGRMQGVMVDDVKFRFSRLGFDEERLAALDQSKNLLLEMEELRKGTVQQAYRDTLLQDASESPKTLATQEEQLLEEELDDLRRNRNSRQLEVGRNAGFEREQDDRPTLFEQ
jgi:hypothetical protein